MQYGRNPLRAVSYLVLQLVYHKDPQDFVGQVYCIYQSLVRQLVYHKDPKDLVGQVCCFGQ